MAHIAFIAPPLAGHFNPLLALAAELRERGHRCTFIGQPDAIRLVAGHDVGFFAVGASSHPTGSLDVRMASMAMLNGPFGLGGMIGDVAALTDMLCREAPLALRQIGVELIVADQMEAAGGLVAEHLDLPFVSAAIALPVNREPGVPPPYVPWRYDPSERGLWRNRGGYRVADWLMRPVAAVIERHSRAFGLPLRSRAEDCLSPAAQIAQAVTGLDFPRRELPSSFHYLGPFRHGREREFPLPDDPRPLAFCSLGTLQGSRASIFLRVAEACRSLGLRLVIAHGGRLQPKAMARLAGDPVVAAYVPQRAVLRRAAVAITHAGFNTVLDALSFGVPMVAMPLAFEQPGTGARLKRVGAAEVVSPRASERRLRRAIEAVLGEPGYRQAAGRLQEEIAAAGGVTRAADIVERSLV